MNLQGTHQNSFENLLNQPVSRRRFVTIASATIAAVAATQIIPQKAYATESKIALIHTNDVHCEISPNEDKGYVGYAGAATIFKEAQTKYGAENTLLIDGGDMLSGQVAGALTEGAALVDIMNGLDYSYSTVGNHDFDFGVDKLLENSAAAEFKMLSCNIFRTGNSTPLFKPYDIKTICDKKVAFVGITTPETLVKSNPASFMDESKTIIYSFKEDATGQALYSCVQENVDAAREEGADYVVALAHLGQSGIADRWRSDTVVAQTSGIDVLIDGHSHEKYIQTVKNKNNQDVIIVQTGTQLFSVGRVVIDPVYNTINAELLGAPIDEDPVAKKVVDEVEAAINEETKTVVGYSNDELVAVYDEGISQVARMRETNLGDLSADAFRARLNADIGLLGGGSLRDNIEQGDITYGNIISVMPFFNTTVVIKTSGATILDALEMGSRAYPNTLGGFLQVSGLSYEIRSDIESTVEVDESLNFIRVAGQRRVQNVRVHGTPIDETKSYIIAGNIYQLCNGGDGYTMFQNSELVVSEGPKDYQIFLDYIVENLNRVVGDEYENKYGQGRIVIKDGPDPIDPENPQDDKTVPKTGDELQAVTVVAAGAALAGGAALLAASRAASARDEE